MTTRRRWAAVFLATVLLPILSCGGGGDGADGEAPSSGRMDLAVDPPAFTVAFRPGDLRGDAPESVAAGDFNGDGAADLLLGAPSADGPEGSRTDAGEALVVFGPIAGDIDLSSRAPDLRILGASAGDLLGTGVAAGDLNGDGVDDIIVGAPGSNGIPEMRTDMGEAYVVFGGSGLPATIDAREKEYDFLLQPAEGFSSLGKTFAVADINEDGISDLVAGAPFAGREEGTPPGSPRTTVGEVYIVFGRPGLGGVATVVSNDEDVRLSGVNEYDQFGVAVAAADVNGDTVPDIIVGASGFDGPGGESPEAGGIFVFYGGAALPSHKTYLQADVTIAGRDANDAFGALVAAVDANGDGKAEVIGAAPSAAGPDNERFAAGEVTVVDVAASGAASLTAEDGAHIFAPTDGELLSGSLAAIAGDRPRIAFGSTKRTTPERPGSGWVYLLDIPAADVDLASESSGALLIKGAAENDGLGGGLAFADLDGDRKPELLAEAAGVQSGVGAPAFTGRLFVIRLPG